MSESTTIARHSIGSRLIRLVIGAGALAFTVFVVYLLAFEPHEDRPRAPEEFWIPLGIGTLAVVIGVGLIGRNLHAFKLQPRIELSPAGIVIHTWQLVGLRRVFLPWHAPVTYSVPWGEFKGCETFTQRVNGIVTEQLLHINTSRGRVTLPWGIYDQSVHRLQLGILDYVEMQFRRPRREAAGLADFQRRRFAEPWTFAYRTTPLWQPLACWAGAAAPLLLLLPGSLPGDDALTLIILVPVVLGPVGFFLMTSWWRDRHHGRLELRADGLVISGPDEHPPATRWEDVLFVRPITRTSTTAWNRAGQPWIDALEIRLADGRTELIKGPKHDPLDRLHALLEPNLDLVAQARERMRHGEKPEAVVAALGLPARF